MTEASSFPWTSRATLNALSIQSDGKIIAAGHSGVLNGSVSDGRWFEIFRSGPTAMDFALVRYNEDGSLDTTFGAQGKVETDLNTPADVIYAVSLQPDGKIIAPGESDLFGWSTYVFGLARYNRDGSLDTTFGIDGKVRMDLPSGQAATAHFVGIQPDGKIVVTGKTRRSTPPRPDTVPRDPKVVAINSSTRSM